MHANFKGDVDTRICRLCLAKTTIYFSLTEINNVSETLKLLTSLEIYSTDEISTVMCYKCNLNMKLVCKIQQNIIEAQKRLGPRSFYEAATIATKEEILSETEDATEENGFQRSESHLDEAYFLLESLTCDICEKVFKTKRTLKRHKLGVHEKLGDFKCELCPKTFSSKMKVYNHKYKVHSDVLAKCESCGKVFTGRSKLKDHKYNVHQKKGRLKSGEKNGHVQTAEIKRESEPDVSEVICNVKEEIVSENEHEGEKNSIVLEPPYTCDICDKVLKTRRILVRHKIAVHSNSKAKFKCELCPRIFANKIRLHDHKYSVHSSKVTQCHICNKSFVSRSKLNEHMKKFHTKEEIELKCQTCDKLCLGKKSLQNHIYRCHNKVVGNFECEVCDKTFTDMYSFTTHKRTNHIRKECKICKKEITQTNMRAHLKTHGDKVVCELCGVSVTALSLPTHIKITHGTPKHKCQFCDRFFKFKKNRLHHEKRHLGQKDFVCEHCGKKFLGARYLKSHVQTKHLKLKTFRCDVCEKEFSSVYAVKTHRRIHTNETPYKCQICGEGFRQNVSLKSHLKSKHGVEEEITVHCDECGKGFGSRHALHTHQRVHE